MIGRRVYRIPDADFDGLLARKGARDFLVPARNHPGKFYALPQAPQQFKQLLMVAGFDRYFQIAPCFRDEASRADRSPGEFYQLDFEMSFVTQEDVFNTIEPVIAGVFEEFADGRGVSEAAVSCGFPMTKSLLKYGSDKPDLRNPLLVTDVTEAFRGSGFGLFAKIIEGGGIVRAIPAPGAGGNPRSLLRQAERMGAGRGRRRAWAISPSRRPGRRGRLPRIWTRARAEADPRGLRAAGGRCGVLRRRQAAGCGEIRRRGADQARARIWG